MIGGCKSYEEAQNYCEQANEQAQGVFKKAARTTAVRGWAEEEESEKRLNQALRDCALDCVMATQKTWDLMAKMENYPEGSKDYLSAMKRLNKLKAEEEEKERIYGEALAGAFQVHKAKNKLSSLTVNAPRARGE
jgi:hypothetical protein